MYEAEQRRIAALPVPRQITEHELQLISEDDRRAAIDTD